VKLAVSRLFDVDHAPLPTVTDRNWLMTSGTPTVRVSFNPVLAKLSLPTDSMRLTADSNATGDEWAEPANDTAAPPIASALNTDFIVPPGPNALVRRTRS
jgi:hypothetical protein